MKKMLRFFGVLLSSVAFMAALNALNSACFTTYYQPATSSELDEYRR